MFDKIMQAVTTGIASIGGIGALIAIITTIIKTFGGNSVKAKLAAVKVDTDKTIASGLENIGNTVESKIRTDITVDISEQVNDAVRRELKEQKEQNNTVLERLNDLSSALAQICRANSVYGKAVTFKDELLASAEKLETPINVEHEKRAVAHVTLDTDKLSADTEKSQETAKDGDSESVKGKKKRLVVV